MFLSKFEQKINLKFKDKNLLKEALTHRSYLNENPDWEVPHNERLEYLGDAVLELAVSDNLFHAHLQYNEGQLTNIRAALVNFRMLTKVAESLELEKFILLSRGEAKDGGRAKQALLANAIEAVIGALYLDQGYETAKKFVEEFILIHEEEVIKEGLDKDAKSLLQEIVQDKFKITPVYKLLEEEGPAHQKEFKMGVFLNDNLVAEGKGFSKQEAETEAAKNALEEFEDIS